MVHVSEVEQLLDRLYIAAEGAGLRTEDRKKAREVAAMLEEIERAVGRISRRASITLVDAAAGKSYVGLLAAKLVLDPAGRRSTVITIERDAERVDSSLRALQRLESSASIEFRKSDVDVEEAWPQSASIIAALHACGPAADAVIDRTIKTHARHLLLVPCCTSSAIPFAARVQNRATAAGIPPQAPVRRRFIQAMVDAERTWRLEAAGYQTEVVEFVPPTVTPHNLLWRARYVGETRRMNSAKAALEGLCHNIGF